MQTTIAVKDDTLNMLRKAKEESKAESIDMLIRKMLIDSKRPRKSLFGAAKGIKAEFKREELDRFS